jgi:hypothetical protein
MKPEIKTASGYMFNFVDNTNNVYSILDVAHHLSNLARFNGATRVHLPVAQHSVWASYVCKPEVAYEFLMHDAHEAYVGDVTSPLKSILPDYREVENRVHGWCAEAFGYTYPTPLLVKRMDQLAYLTEARDFMPDYEEDDTLLPKLKAMSPHEAFTAFVRRYLELTGRVLDSNHARKYYKSQIPWLVSPAVA